MQKKKLEGGIGMKTLLQNMSEKIKIFKRQLLKKIMLISSTLTRSSTHCILQADKSIEPLPIILSEISHLLNYRVQN